MSWQMDKIEYRGIPRDPDGYWTVASNDCYTIRAGRIAHSIPTFGYAHHLDSSSLPGLTREERGLWD